MDITPTRSEFLALAQTHPVIPVTMTQLGDRETPVSAFEKLVGPEPGFLLESVKVKSDGHSGRFWAGILCSRSPAPTATV